MHYNHNTMQMQYNSQSPGHMQNIKDSLHLKGMKRSFSNVSLISITAELYWQETKPNETKRLNLIVIKKQWLWIWWLQTTKH